MTVLVALSESRFKSDAVQKTSRGVFQQTPGPDLNNPWWPTWNGTTAEQAAAFLAAFAKIKRTQDPVRDAYQIQRWLAPDPAVDPVGFRIAPESKNYVTCWPFVADLIRTGRLPANLP